MVWMTELYQHIRARISGLLLRAGTRNFNGHHLYQPLTSSSEGEEEGQYGTAAGEGAVRLGLGQAEVGEAAVGYQQHNL